MLNVEDKKAARTPPATQPARRALLARMAGMAALGGAGSGLLLAGCASDVKLDDAEAARKAEAAVREARAREAAAQSAVGATNPSVRTVDLERQQAPADPYAGAGALERAVYFDYDSDAIRADARPVLEGWARALSAQKGRHALIEGHTDERGGREYNLALGQRRAEAVVQALVLMGVAQGQLEAVSFGKERPADAGGNEDAFARNRRAELKLK